MNSYAFYGRNLIKTIQRYLPPNFERNKVEELFLDGETNIEDYHRGVRKRVIITMDFAHSFRVDNMSNCFEKLNSETEYQEYLRAQTNMVIVGKWR